ncbi:hypothetical protein MAUB1S_04212 [Mycolicibacterium aubagnense]
MLADGAVVDGELGTPISKATGVPAASSTPSRSVARLAITWRPPPPQAPPPGAASAASRPLTARSWPRSGQPERLANGGRAHSHSYDPKYLGQPPQIVAGRFTPQPGKGVVRSNMFIPTDQVQSNVEDGTDILNGRTHRSTTATTRSERQQRAGGLKGVAVRRLRPWRDCGPPESDRERRRPAWRRKGRHTQHRCPRAIAGRTSDDRLQCRAAPTSSHQRPRPA